MTVHPPSCPNPCPRRRVGCHGTCDIYKTMQEWHEARRAAEKKDSSFFGSMSETSWRIKKRMNLKGA